MPEDRAAQEYTALMLARAAEAKDPTTGLHLERMYHYSLALARAMEFSEAAALEIATAAMLHDIGKLMVADTILQNPGPLTEDEWAIIRRHPAEGSWILGDSPVLAVARDIARWHHERWDGCGYPDGLRGDEIPLHAALVSVADVYDALTSPRPYKPPWPAERAITELRQLRGNHLHPEAVASFIRLWEQGALLEDPVGGTPTCQH